MPTLLNTFVGAPATTHVINIGTPTAGLDVFVAVGAAASLSSPSSPWSRIGYVVGFNGGGIYHLPAASNDGSITTLSVTLNGPRQLSAVSWQDQLVGSPTVYTNAQSGYTSGTTIVSGAFTATAGTAVIAFMGINGPSDPVIPAASSLNQGFSILGSTTPEAVSNEDSITTVGSAADIALSSQAVTATYVGSWAHSSVVLLTTYEVSSAPTVTGTASITPGGLSLTAAGQDLPTSRIDLGGVSLAGQGTTVSFGTASVALGGLSLAGQVDDTETPGTAVYTVKAAILARLRALTADSAGPLWGFNVLDRIPTTKADLRGPTGYIMIIYPTESDGTADVQVMTGGVLRFDETSTLTLRIEVIGRTTEDSQPVVDRLAGRALREVMAEISSQQSWDNRIGLGLTRFDYLWFIPAEISTISTRVDGVLAAGAGISLGIRIQARHSYGG